jgi:hypothetical protein
VYGRRGIPENLSIRRLFNYRNYQKVEVLVNDSYEENDL